jgi:large subunit ribosomal protein L30
MTKKLKLTQVRSLIGTPPKHRLTMRAIGFHHHQEILTKDDTPQLRGMLHQVAYLVRVEEAAEGAVSTRASRTPVRKGRVEGEGEAPKTARVAKAPRAKTARKAPTGTSKKAAAKKSKSSRKESD